MFIQKISCLSQIKFTNKLVSRQKVFLLLNFLIFQFIIFFFPISGTTSLNPLTFGQLMYDRFHHMLISDLKQFRTLDRRRKKCVCVFYFDKLYIRAHGVYLVIFISLCFNALGRSKVSQSTSQRVENEKNISQIVRVSEVCVQNGERVSRNDKSCHICMRLKKAALKEFFQ